MNVRDLELVEQYLNGELEGEALLSFEKRLQDDVDISQAVAAHKALLLQFNNYGKRQDLKNKLRTFHAEMESEGKTKYQPEKRRALMSVVRRRYFPSVAAAACVSIMAATGTFFAVRYTDSLQQKQQSNYLQLKRKFDILERKQRKLENTIDTAMKYQAADMSTIKYDGTCFAISPNGYLITNYHLVSKSDSIVIESYVEPKHRYRAEMVYADAKRDLAILKINDKRFKTFGKLPYALDQKQMDLGEDIFTLAYPREEIVYGNGAISAHSGYEGNRDAYQISIPVNPGNSGCPVFDDKGNVIGVVSGKQFDAEGVGFAVKSGEIIKMVEQLPETDSIKLSLSLPRANRLSGQKRPEQIKKIQEFIFQVKVY